MVAQSNSDLESQIGQWRAYVLRRQAMHAQDVEELESHLRDQVEALQATGLDSDEAFLVAVKRMGSLDGLSREFAREHSERLWKQLVLPSEGNGELAADSRRELLVAIGLAIGAALAIKAPVFFGVDVDAGGDVFYARNVSLLILPFLAGYFVWKRGVSAATVAWMAVPFVVGAVFANAYPFAPNAHTEVLLALHLPMALWLAMGVAYAGGDWRSSDRRMDFVRFSGEFFIYFVLIALGGGVLTAFTLMIFESIGVSVEALAAEWLLPCGAAGAVVIAAWLVEAKQSVIENMAPVLTRVFTPLFALLLIAFLVTMIWTRSGIDVAREVLIGFDLLLALVLGLLLYAISARDPRAPAGAFDVMQLVLVIAALIVDVLALIAIAGRISEFGFSPNKVAALGENIILLVNLAWSAVLYVGFLRGTRSFGALERWQTGYLPVFFLWAAIVVLLFPPLFGFN